MQTNHIARRIVLVLIILSSVILIANIPSHIDVGVNGQYREIRMPLYVKWIEFIGRHYEYDRLSREITAGCRSDEDKVMAILHWIKRNITNVPSGMPVCDDHVLNIIIRGYGKPDQFQDVFTTLCAYSDIPAFYDKVYDNAGRNKYIFSFVRLNGVWSVFDAYRGVYFVNNGEKIASIDDIISDRFHPKGADIDKIITNGVTYREYLKNIKGLNRPSTPRAYKQMPFHRIMFEAKKALGMEKEE